MVAVQRLQRETARTFGESEHETWRVLYEALEENRQSLAHPLFAQGLVALGIRGEKIPDLATVNSRLGQLTGWRGVPVTGLEGGSSFYPALAAREFPLGNFIRDRDSLGYTPAPDIFHDLYGHIPFFADPAYARFCQAYGEMASKHLGFGERLKRLERFFWFTIEFALCETLSGRRIFGAGILSSRDESLYSLSATPEVRPFSVAEICAQDYRIDQIQSRLFILKSPEQLYSSLADVDAEVRRF